MEDNFNLKRGLITQSLSPVFILLIIRHMHLDYISLIRSFICACKIKPWDTIIIAIGHPRLGELLVVIISICWLLASILSIPAFEDIQTAGFESHGELAKAVEEKRDVAASFLMTFILPLLIDELSSPQKWISYILVICVLYAVLYKSNLYYQSPVLAVLGYKVFSFEVKNPYERSRLKPNTEYIGIAKGDMISDRKAIIWKHIADNVFLVYNERRER